MTSTNQLSNAYSKLMTKVWNPVWTNVVFIITHDCISDIEVGLYIPIRHNINDSLCLKLESYDFKR